MAGKRAVKPDLRYECFKNFELFDKDRNLLLESNEVWDKACQSLSLKKRNLYEYVKQDRKGIKTNLLKYLDDKNTRVKQEQILTKYTENSKVNDFNDKGINSEADLFSSDIKSNNDQQSENEDSEEEYYDLEDIHETKSEVAEDYTKNIMKNLQDMRLDIAFKKYIRLTSYVDFCVMYWSPEQVVFYKAIVKNLKQLEIILTQNCVNPVHGDTEISLYSVTGSIDGSKTYSFCNMLTENVSYLYLFLTEWLKFGASVSEEIFCPCIYEVLSAVCDALNKSMDYQKYLLICLSYLENILTQRISILPECVIRINSIHVINWVENLQCFQNQNIKKFYKYCIIYLTTITDCEIFIQALKMIFVLSSSKCENEHCLKFKQNLITIFKEQQIQIDCEISESIQIQEVLNLIVPEKVIQYFKSIRDSINDLCSDEENFYDAPNAYLCNDFARHLVILCAHFPLWSSLVRNKMIIQASLSLCIPTESKERLNPDIFLQEHVLAINEHIKVGRSEFYKPTKKFPFNNDNDQSYLYKTENWMGLGIENCNYTVELEVEVEEEDTIMDMENNDSNNLSSKNSNVENLSVIENEFKSFSFPLYNEEQTRSKISS